MSALIGLMILNPDVRAAALNRHLLIDGNSLEAIVYNRIAELALTGQPCDVVALAQQLAGVVSPAWLHQCLSAAPLAVDPVRYVAEVLG